MHVTMVAVCSADGKMTKGDSPHVHAWASPEDAAHFLQLIEQHRVVIMGRGTYESVHPQPQPERLRVVLTHQPDNYVAEAVPGSLEFMDVSAGQLLAQLAERGYDAALVVGGSVVNADFLQADLVNDLFLTIEPVIFGEGTPLLAATSDARQMRLAGTTRLNSRGTMLLHYRLAPSA